MAKLRKIYLVVEEQKIFGEGNYEFIHVYRNKAYAEKVCQGQNEHEIASAKMLWGQDKPIRTYKVHGFYLLHESFFD